MEPDLALYRILAIAIPVIIAITLHEAAHGYVAWRLGDDTAYRMGRVTFNPIKHIDAFGTILLPAMLWIVGAQFLFGWAKPVPVNFGRLRRPRRDMVLVAAAGPGTNIALAWVSGVLIHLAGLFPAGMESWLILGLGISILINSVLATFNMIPLPPLDGGRVAVGLLPDKFAYRLARLERWGMLILIGVLFILPIVLARIGIYFDIFGWVIWPIVSFIVLVVQTVTGADAGSAVVEAIRLLVGPRG